MEPEGTIEAYVPSDNGATDNVLRTLTPASHKRAGGLKGQTIATWIDTQLLLKVRQCPMCNALMNKYEYEYAYF